MSERILKFMLSELSKVRIVCPRPQCGAVVEMPIEQMAIRYGDRNPECPVCKHEFVGVGVPPGQNQTAFARLAGAILELQGNGKANPPDVKIEFVIPDPASK